MPRYAIRMKLLADYPRASSPGRMDAMTSLPNLDLRAQAELLTYLAALTGCNAYPYRAGPSG